MTLTQKQTQHTNYDTNTKINKSQQQNIEHTQKQNIVNKTTQT